MRDLKNFYPPCRGLSAHANRRKNFYRLQGRSRAGNKNYTGGEDTRLRENNSLELFGFHGSGYAAVGEGLIKISSVRMRTQTPAWIQIGSYAKVSIYGAAG